MKSTEKEAKDKNPLLTAEIKENARDLFEKILEHCSNYRATSGFMALEKEIRKLIFQLGCVLLQLALSAAEDAIDYDAMRSKYRRAKPISRKLVYWSSRHWVGNKSRELHGKCYRIS